ncbi:13987_t:CDS:2, partial [Cetraspora pellucida]
GHQERLFSEFYDSKWWCRAQQNILSENKVLAIILFFDATTLDRLGKSSWHPIFISLGNIPTNLRNKTEAKALVGIMLTLQGTKEEQKTPEFRQLVRSVFHKCINVLIEPLRLQYHSGIMLKVNNYNLKCSIMLACVIGNWPENCKSCLTYSGASCARPCHTYLVGKDELNAINLPNNHMIVRTENRMRQIVAMKQGKDYSLYEETNNNYLGTPYVTQSSESTVPERMHHLDLGLFSHMVKYTQDLLKAHSRTILVNKMDQRLGLIPRYPGLKIFNTGLADLALFTASKYKHMMKVMPFVLE